MGNLQTCNASTSPNDRTRIWKMIHEWIPTQVSPGNNPSQEIDQLCPTCHWVLENPKHLFHCTSPTRTALWQKLQTQLTTLCTELELDPHWYQLWWMGLIHPNNPNIHTLNLYPPNFHPIHQSQQTIGWQQLYYGCLSTQWIQYLITHHPKLDPICTLTQMLRCVLNYILEVWTSHNNDHHSTTLCFPPTWHPIFMVFIPPMMHCIFHLTKDKLLSKPQQYIQTWI